MMMANTAVRGIMLCAKECKLELKTFAPAVKVHRHFERLLSSNAEVFEISSESRLHRRLMKLKKKGRTSAVSTAASSVDVSPLEKLRIEKIPTVPTLPSEPAAKKIVKQEEKTFNDLGLSSELISAVNDLELTKPTEIQFLGIPSVLEHKDVVLASHTGSGKTFAYLMPIVQLLREDERQLGYTSKARKPRAIVMCPTRELAEQVLQVAKSLCHHARFRSAMISGGGPMKPQQESLQSALDLVVGTPGRLVQHLKEGNLSLNEVKYLVLDEADTMFDRGFGAEVRRLISPIRRRCLETGQSFQTVLVTATITKAVRRLLDEEFPGIEHVQTSTLHKKVASSRHDFVQVKGDENKLEVLRQILHPSLRKNSKIMVFCNTVKSCRAVDHVLNDNNINTANYHGEVPAEERVENLERFREGCSSSKSEDDELEWNSGRQFPPVLVCTDLAARGLDLTVDHVVMFDFPNNPIDYLHRTGRTARMGAKGRVTSLVTKHDYFLANQIEQAIYRGESLDALTKDKVKVEKMKQRESEEKRRAKEREARKDGKTLVGRGGKKVTSKFSLKGPSKVPGGRTGRPGSSKGKSVTGAKPRSR